MATPASARRQSSDPLERFDRPAWMTAALLEKVPAVGGGRKGLIVEPCAGNGAIVEVLEHHYRSVRSYDLEPRTLDLPLLGTVRDVGVQRADATSKAFWLEMLALGVTWGVSNPPFSLGTEIRNLARDLGLRLALLLRVTALEPTEDRAPRLEADPPSDLVLMPRGTFAGPGTAFTGGDIASAFWFVWRYPDARPGQGTRLHVLTPDERLRLQRDYGPGWKRRRRGRRRGSDSVGAPACHDNGLPSDLARPSRPQVPFGVVLCPGVDASLLEPVIAPEDVDA